MLTSALTVGSDARDVAERAGLESHCYLFSETDSGSTVVAGDSKLNTGGNSTSDQSESQSTVADTDSAGPTTFSTSLDSTSSLL